jgi:hypothetical protein
MRSMASLAIGEAWIFDHRRAPPKCDSAASDGTQTRDFLPGRQALHALIG